MTTAFQNNDWVSIDDTRDIILASMLQETCDVSFLLLGEPGIAKTAMAMDVARIATESDGVKRISTYIDVPTTDPSDIGIPIPNHETGTTRLYPNEAFKFHLMGEDGDPGVLIYDELSKGVMPVQNMLHPSLTMVDGARRIGATRLHRRTVVVATGNLNSDGVGDALKSHTRNRVIVLYVRKPTNEEFLSYAIGAGIHPMIAAWIANEPRLFKSYTDGDFETFDDETLMLIHNPTAKSQNKQQAVVTPRSIMMASSILHAAEAAGIRENLLTAQLHGAWGATATRLFMAFRSIGKDLPSPKDIVADPEGTPVPTSAAAQMIMGFKAPHWMTANAGGLAAPKTRLDVVARINAYFKYIKRMSAEQQAVFVNHVKLAHDNAVKAKKTTDMSKLWDVLTGTEAYQQWAVEHNYMFTK